MKKIVKNDINMNWFMAATARVVKTVAQTMLGMITVGATLTDIKWGYILSVSAVAGLYSFLTSIVINLPEVNEEAIDGSLTINNDAENNETMHIHMKDNIDIIKGKKNIKLNVNNTHDKHPL